MALTDSWLLPRTALFWLAVLALPTCIHTVCRLARIISCGRGCGVGGGTARSGRVGRLSRSGMGNDPAAIL